MSLQGKFQDGLSPFIIKIIYDTISNAKTFNDLEPFFSLNNIDYIRIKINKILEENNLSLEQYYIKTNNLWGVEYVDSELQVIYASGEYDAVSASLKKEINKMSNSELKNKYLNILPKDRERCAIVDANKDCTQTIDIIKNEIKTIICSSTKNDFIENYRSFIRILIKMHRRIKRLFPKNTKGEEISKQIMNDFIVRVWEIYNDINIQNKIKNIINNNNDNSQIDKYYESGFYSLKNILSSIEFQNKTPIDQFKQLNDWYNNIGK